MKDTSLCHGCQDDWYNANNPSGGIRGCWNLRSARVVRRWRLGWWTTPATPGAFVEVHTYKCHHETGRNAFYEKLPACAIGPVKLKIEPKARTPKETTLCLTT